MYRSDVVTLICVLAAASSGFTVVTAKLYVKSYPNGRIVGGTPASIEDHPWQVSLQVLGFHVCGGSIISKSVVLTAGHCTEYRVTWLSARVGSSTLHNGGAVHRVTEAVRHEDYKVKDNGVLENDIAILKLRTTIEFAQGIQPIPLFKQGEDSPGGALSTISGWGATQEGGIISVALYTVDVPVVTKAACNEVYSIYDGISVGQICAAVPEGGKDSCQGDSGGPMVIGGRQAGIVSWGMGCARKGYPGVYTEVSFYRDWILKHSNV